MSDNLDDTLRQLTIEPASADDARRTLDAGFAVFTLEHQRSPIERKYFAFYRGVAQPVGVGVIVLAYLQWGVRMAFG